MPDFDQGRPPTERLRSFRHRRPLRWWELLLPAGIWIMAAKLMLESARALGRSGIAVPSAVFSLIRASGQLSQIGFRVWRHQRGKWR